MNESVLNMNCFHFGPNDLVCYKDTNGGIYSAGVSVKSIMMNAGISPIMTLNTNNMCDNKDGFRTREKVSDLFDDLVVPNWALSYIKNHPMRGGTTNAKQNENKSYNSDSDESDDDDVVQDDLHDRLLDLVKEHDARKLKTPAKKRLTRKSKIVKNKTKKMK
jgi:hypothetical protein